MPAPGTPLPGNDGFAGEYGEFWVMYRGGRPGRPKAGSGSWRAGWYAILADRSEGPFSSSRRAYGFAQRLFPHVTRTRPKHEAA